MISGSNSQIHIIFMISTGKFYSGGIIRSDVVKMSWIVLNTPILLKHSTLISTICHDMHFFQFSFDPE